ncbi:MAG: LLM class flavin-dependent oxidoreductase [Promethearchaeota archaeon]
MTDTLKFGVVSTPSAWDRILDTATYIEKMGFDSFWMPDHTVGFGIRRWDALEAWSALSAVATQTKKVKLGTCVGDTYRHHPSALAQMVTTCDHISNGRAIVGVGLGEAMNLFPFGIDLKKPLGRTEEAVKVMRLLWTQELSNFDGKYYKLDNAFLQPRPIQEPNPPVWIAANSPKTMKMAGELGDGWVPASMFPDEYAKKLKIVRDHAKQSGRDPNAIEPAAFVFTVVAEEYETARKNVGLGAKIYFLTRPRILRRLGYDDVTDEFDMTWHLVMNSEVTEKLLAMAKEIPDDVLDKAPVFFGTPDDVIKGIKEYQKAGVRHMVVNFFVPPKMLKDTLKLFATEVIPEFR